MHHTTIAMDDGGKAQIVEKEQALDACPAEGFRRSKTRHNVIRAQACGFHQFDIGIERLIQRRMQGDIAKPQRWGQCRIKQ